MSKFTTESIFISCLVAVLVACSDEDSNTNPTNPTSDAQGDALDTSDGDGEPTTNADAPPDSDTPPTCDLSNPDADTDGDGVANNIEAAAGYAPCDPDTDDDGLCDGPQTVGTDCISGEDLNADGRLDPGETSATNPVSDGGVFCDGPRAVVGVCEARPATDTCAQTRSLVCNAETFGSVQAKPARSARTNLALPASFSIVEHADAQASAFSDPAAGIYGYATKRTLPSTQNIAVSFRAFEQTLGAASQNRSNAFWRVFTTWTGRELSLTNNAVQSRGAFSYGTGSNNPSITSQDPAALRDLILSQLSGTPITTEGVSGTPCTNIISHHIEERREDNTLITLGVLACASDHQQPTTALFFDDFLNATLFSIAEEERAYTPDDIGCDCIENPNLSASVDFLWIIDNSGSMADEQVNVANTADDFMGLLLSSPVDWRLGITTTDAYLLGLDPSAVTPLLQSGITLLQQDPARELCTGLRNLGGFLTPSTPNVQDVFVDLVTQNTACANPVGLPGDNICGFGLERGLATAAFVLDRLLSPSADPSCPTGSAYQLRKGEDQKTVIIWVSDEEDEEMADPNSTPPGAIFPPNSPARLAVNQHYQDLFTQLATDNGLSLSLHAIVGDDGQGNGGICQPLISGQIQGASPGLAYIDAAYANGGAVGTICSSDLSVTIDAIIRSTIGQSGSIPLPPNSLPISSSIRVAVGNNVISRINNGSDPYWTYDADTNAITLFRFNASGSVVAIAFKAWKPTEL